MFNDLTDDNFQLFAMKFYNNPACSDVLEFQDDVKRIRYVKRLFKKYHESGDLKERLILNHLTILYNTFEPKAMTRMLLLKMDGYTQYLKPFLLLLNYWTVDVGLVDGKRLKDSEIPLDVNIVRILRQI